MPRIQLHGIDYLDAPVSIAAAAKAVGSTPATLRTWERRYGIGPSLRSSGSVRKYTAADILTLRRMKELREQGVNPADAAKHALAETSSAATVTAVGNDFPADLAIAATNADLNTIRLLIARQIYSHGLVRTYCDYVEPAVLQLANRTTGDVPGQDPYSLVRRVVMEAARDVSDQSQPLGVNPPQALVVTGANRYLAGHVSGAALRWNGIDVRVISKSGHDVIDSILTHLEHRPVDVVVLIDEENHPAELIEQLLGRGSNVICVGKNPPPILNSQVLWMRTLRAVLSEVQDILSVKRVSCE
ncbi:MerR family transcriptional regulator [Boudabousia marimammalium]|uniref:HTH merR-type domain-containing protein n=1 Tax=Boudabousia marimammalium TaxID=156892 RepID=A0A1Q5PM43_9ACTO|nr:MerR family transcriptional regulator [Boudabousia marimammalium]OKL48119.1 hypothetical protein BM477_06590 [Boudabousia marimammalium]